MFGPQIWVTRHCANDWLAACWIILWGNLFLTLVAMLVLFDEIVVGDGGAIFTYAVGYE